MRESTIASSTESAKTGQGLVSFATETGGLTIHAAIAAKKDELTELCQRYNVARLEVFGSAARGTDFDPQTSDADFLVDFRLVDGRTPLQQYFDFAEALRQTLGRSVDLIESGAVKNPYLRAAIDRSRELVYAS